MCVSNTTSNNLFLLLKQADFDHIFQYLTFKIKMLLIGHFRLVFCLCQNLVRRNHSYGNVLRLPVHFHANQTHFHMKGLARILVLKQRHKVTRKWPTNTETSFFLMLIVLANL